MASSVALLDVDRDGRPDVVTADFDSTVRVFLVSPSGKLGKAGEIGIAGAGVAIVAGDLNGDRRPDLLVGDDAAGSAELLLARPGGRSAYRARCREPHAVAIADVDGDGRSISPPPVTTSRSSASGSEGAAGASRRFCVCRSDATEPAASPSRI